MYIRQSEVPALVSVGQSFVVEAEQVEQGGIEVVYVDGVSADVESKVIGFSVNESFLHTSSCEPYGEASIVMVASVVAALYHGGASEFAAPDHKCVVEHTAAFQIDE